jgi:hypothetical protein
MGLFKKVVYSLFTIITKRIIFANNIEVWRLPSNSDIAGRYAELRRHKSYATGNGVAIIKTYD